MDLSIIIVSFNTKDILIDCLRSVVKRTQGLDYEIIVVDNASADASVQAVEKFSVKIKNLVLIKNAKNIGFGAANNQGIKKAKGKYFLLLNSDTLVRDNVLVKMHTFIERHPKVGIATCALRNADGSLQGTGGYFPNLFRVFAWMFFLEDIPLLDRLIKPFHPMHPHSPFYKGERFFEKAQERDWITGAFFLARKKVVDDIGFFDEDYFMYTEEVDFCYRAKKVGWKVWYLPRFSIPHLGGASSTSEFPILSEYKGIKLFYKKNMPSWQYPIVRVFLKGGALVRIVLFGLLKGREAGETYAKAFKIA